MVAGRVTSFSRYSECWLTVKDLQLVELTARLEVLYGEGDVVSRLYLDHPGAGLKMWETAARRLAHDDAGGGCENLIHGTSHC